MKKRLSIVLALMLAMAFCFFGVGCAGKSAYQIAVDNGFKGTEQQWLESLKGADGTNGKDGKDGKNGTNGNDGQDSQSVSIETLFEAYLDLNPMATFSDFLQQFLVVDHNDIQYAAAVAIQSVVSIFCEFRSATAPGQPAQDYYSAGSGVIYKIEGEYAYIITNYHVVYDRDSSTTAKIARKITVYSYGFEYSDYEVEAEFMGGSITKDIAVLRVSKNGFSANMRAATLGDSNTIALGQRVIAAGNPLAEGLSITSGIISVDSEDIDMEALDYEDATITVRVMRTDTSINSGNSGGGMFDMRGNLIGIVNAKTIDDGVEGMGYAIPINVARGIADSVLYNSSKKCVMGITVQATDMRTVYNINTNQVEIIQTLQVESVQSAMAQAVLQVGDQLVSAKINNGASLQITRLFHLSDLLYDVRLGDTIHLTIIRNSTTQTVSLTPTEINFAAI